MNNKGFAITGILYTLFVLFVMILLSVLGAISYKKGILEKTVSDLEKSFELVEVPDINTTFFKDEETNKVVAIKNGKFEFKVNYQIDGNLQSTTCTTYLTPGQIIPEKIDPTIPNLDFTLIPTNCNDYSFEISLAPTTEQNKLTLTKVYEFRGNE